MAPKRNAAVKQITGSHIKDMLDTLVDVVCAMDIQGTIIYINHAVTKSWGYEPGEMIGKNIRDFIRPQDQSGSQQTTENIPGEGEHAFINGIRKRDGSTVEVQWHNTWNKQREIIFGIVTDVAVKKRTRSLRNELGHELDNYYKTVPDLLERITDGFFAVDRDFVVTYWNNKSETLLGVSKPEILGKNLWDLFSEGIDSYIYRQHQRAMHEHVSQEYEAYYAPMKMWFRINTYPSPNGLSVFFKDISNAKRLEEELQKGIRQRQKMITATIIKAEERVRTEIGKELHDNINQILTTAKLYMEICLNDEIPNKEMLGKSLEHLSHCIQEIRGLSKVISAPWIESISIRESMSDLLDMLKVTREMHTSLSTSGLEGKKIDQEIHIALHRIAQEHLTNIINHSGASTVNISISATLTHVIMHISDDGVGFDLKAKRKGIGLLNMSSRAEALNGTLVIESAPGEGCRLSVNLPLQTEELH